MSKATATRGKDAPILCPFTVQIDSAEQLPYSFQGLRANSSQRNRPIEVPTIRKHMKTGDYSILGYSDQIVIERKSKEDLYGSVARRENFEDRLARMEEIINAGGWAAIVVESHRRDVIDHPPPYSELNPKSLNRTILAWEIRFKTRWLFIAGRDYAEAMTFRALERFYEDRIKEKA